jgi:hypothetical protein
MDYPDNPGAKGSGITRTTSEAAADAIAQSVKYLQLVVIRVLATHGPATVLECVANTIHTRESLAPRVSELRAMGLVEPTGERRHNPSGRKACVWNPDRKSPRTAGWRCCMSREHSPEALRLGRLAPPSTATPSPPSPPTGDCFSEIALHDRYRVFRLTIRATSPA